MAISKHRKLCYTSGLENRVEKSIMLFLFFALLSRLPLLSCPYHLFHIFFLLIHQVQVLDGNHVKLICIQI